nr:MAG TPA: hypothetical protein [Caudoviricetes sp.]
MHLKKRRRGYLPSRRPCIGQGQHLFCCSCSYLHLNFCGVFVVCFQHSGFNCVSAGVVQINPVILVVVAIFALGGTGRDKPALLAVHQPHSVKVNPRNSERKGQAIVRNLSNIANNGLHTAKVFTGNADPDGVCVLALVGVCVLILTENHNYTPFLSIRLEKPANEELLTRNSSVFWIQSGRGTIGADGANVVVLGFKPRRLRLHIDAIVGGCFPSVSERKTLAGGVHQCGHGERLETVNAADDVHQLAVLVVDTTENVLGGVFIEKDMGRIRHSDRPPSQISFRRQTTGSRARYHRHTHR